MKVQLGNEYVFVCVYLSLWLFVCWWVRKCEKI